MPTVSAKTRGDRLRDMRLAKGLFLRDVARELKCSHVWINDLECGRRKLNLDWALKLATLYGCSVHYLATGED